IGSGLVLNGLNNQWELSKISKVKEFALQLTNYSPEFFPLADWNSALSKAEAQANGSSHYAQRWAELSTNLVTIGRQFPSAHAAAFQQACETRNLAAAERLFLQWKLAQPLLSKVEFAGDYRGLRNEMERDLGRIRAYRRNPQPASEAPVRKSEDRPSAH